MKTNNNALKVDSQREVNHRKSKCATGKILEDFFFSL